MRKNKFLAALAIAACLATSVPFSVNAATPGQAKDASKVHYASVSVDNKAVLKKLFNAEYYKAQNPDLVAAGITTEDALFNHFVTRGVFEGRACCEGFNVAAYKSAYKDLQAAFGDDIVAYYVHFQNFGKAEKRALVTVEAATAAGVTVVSAADGTTVAAAAPAASATSTATSTTTEEKVAEDAEAAKLAKNVAIDSVTGKFYDSSKGDTSKVGDALGVLDGFVAVGGKYFQVVKKEAAFTYDKEKYGVTKDKDGNDVYYDLTVVSRVEASQPGVPDIYVLVDGKYYVKATKDQAYGTAGAPNTGYAKVYDSDNKLHYFATAISTGVGYTIEAKNNSLKDSNGAFHKYEAALDASNFRTYYNALNTEKYDKQGDNIYALAPVYDEKTATVVDSKYTPFKTGYVDKSVSSSSKPSEEKLETGRMVWLEADGCSYEFTTADDADRVLNGKKYVLASGNYYGIVADDTKLNKDNIATYYNLDTEYMVSGGKVYKSAALNGEEACTAVPALAEKKATDGYVLIPSDKYPNAALTAGIHKEVSVETAYTFDSDTYAKSGSDYYNKLTSYTKAEVETYIPKDGYVLGSDAEYHKVVDTKTAYVLDTKNFGVTTVYGKDTYYSKEAIDASVATGTVKVAADGYVLVKGIAYPEVKFEDAFEKKEGYKVTKNAEDGLYYYTK